MLDFITGLVMDGFLPVFLTLLDFLPTVVVLLVLVALFEHSGLILGFSCTTLAVGIAPKDPRYIRMLSFIPCSAKLPVLMFMCTVVLGWSIFGVAFLYILALTIGIILGGYHVLAIPRLRHIGFRDFILLIIRNIIEFLKRISLGLVIAVFALYTLQFFNLLIPIMSLFAPIFTPIGLANPMVLACLVFGLVAKEMIVGAILSFGVVALELTTASAISFIVFALLYTPCLPTLTAIKSKLGLKHAAKTAGFNFLVAYIIAFVFYNLCVILTL